MKPPKFPTCTLPTTLKNLALIGGAATLLTFGGCSQKNKTDQYALLTDENTALREQLDDRNKALESAHMEMREKDMQIAQLRRDVDNIPMAQPATIVQPVTAPVANSTAFDDIPGVTGTMSAGEVTATVESDILFASGKATLRSSARQSLNAVARVLNQNYSGMEVRIAGHTDTDPIRKSGHKSNYHLGFERAYAVRDYLISRGVDADRLYLASHGPDQPQSSKKQSRRVDITVQLY